jgi:hypothetical protein
MNGRMDAGLIFVLPFGEYKLQANSPCCDGYIFPHEAKSIRGFAFQVKSTCEGKNTGKEFSPFFGDFQDTVSQNMS